MADRAAPVISLQHHQQHVDVLIVGAGLSGIAAGIPGATQSRSFTLHR